MKTMTFEQAKRKGSEKGEEKRVSSSLKEKNRKGKKKALVQSWVELKRHDTAPSDTPSVCSQAKRLTGNYYGGPPWAWRAPSTLSSH